jgi:hypothetical protein
MRTAFAIVLISSAAFAQTQPFVPPFISSQTTIFDNETGTVDTGIINDVQHVVGPDPRYVTYGGGAGAASAIYPDGMSALAAYDFQRIPLIGFVGSPLPTEPVQKSRNKGTTPAPQPQGVLATRGITRLTK